MEKIDVDGDKTISFEEYLTLITITSSKIMIFNYNLILTYKSHR